MDSGTPGMPPGGGMSAMPGGASLLISSSCVGYSGRVVLVQEERVIALARAVTATAPTDVAPII